MNMPGGSPPQEEASEIEEVLNALSGSYTMELLCMTTGDLHDARTDPDLFDTLKITHELLVALRDEGVLGTFLSLPKDSQVKFVRWIGATDETDLRRDYTRTFVTALKQSPLADSEHYGAPTPP